MHSDGRAPRQLGQLQETADSLLRGMQGVSLADELNPIFGKYGVDLYLSGHDHVLQVHRRSRPLRTVGLPTPRCVDGSGPLAAPNILNTTSRPIRS